MTALLSPIRTGPIADVEVGMPVVDAAGIDLGHVEDVSMSDPEASTTEGNRILPAGGWVRVLSRAFDSQAGIEPRVDEPLRTRLMRIGYLKVAAGPLHHERYVRADRIARVDAGRVELSVLSKQVDSEV